MQNAEMVRYALKLGGALQPGLRRRYPDPQLDETRPHELGLARRLGTDARSGPGSTTAIAQPPRHLLRSGSRLRWSRPPDLHRGTDPPDLHEGLRHRPDTGRHGGGGAPRASRHHRSTGPTGTRTWLPSTRSSYACCLHGLRTLLGDRSRRSTSRVTRTARSELQNTRGPNRDHPQCGFNMPDDTLDLRARVLVQIAADCVFQPWQPRDGRRACPPT